VRTSSKRSARIDVMTDAELVRQALRGGTSAYEELVRRWSAPVLAVCHARIGRSDVAEDLAQETLLRGYSALRTLSQPEKFGPWLRGIARRVCLDWLKSKQSSQVLFSTLGPEGLPEALLAGDAEATVAETDRNDDIARLMAEIEALPLDYREVLMHYYYHDVTYRQLADLLGVSTATVNARLTKARAELRARLSCFER
jgi:RNA polymerase sigma-70 factor (ECF subfamily)